MPANATVDDGPRVAVFDLDGTLTWRDTLVPYLAGYAVRHPERWIRLWRVPLEVLAFVVGHRDRGRLKSGLIRASMGGASRTEVDAWSDRFVGRLTRRRTFRRTALATLEAHRAAGDHLVLLSASPDLYVPRIGHLLGFERTVCTELEWRQDPQGADRLDGRLRTANRRGAEKSNCLARLRAEYANLRVVAYGNSDSDLPHLRLADRALLVNGNAKARRRAVAAGIELANWP